MTMALKSEKAATPTKLKSGDWGARVKGNVSEGDSIAITTKAGKSWVATVTKIVWSGNGVTIVATESGYTHAKRDTRGYVAERGHHEGYCGYSCPVTGRKCCPTNGPCHDCI